MNYAVGSVWRKWDLHVHTPASLKHRYHPGAATDPWDAYIKALASLSPDFRVLGINDYLFIDGYRRIRDAHRSGRIPNLDMVLPVIELRLDKFGGTSSALSKVNFHVIFSEAVDPDVIEAQFIGRLHATYDLGNGNAWNGAPTKDSIRELGDMIHKTSPSPDHHANADPLHTGWANLTFSLETINEALCSSAFKNRCLRAVGKTEWADIKWTGQGIADKRTIINSANIVFVASANQADFEHAKASLTRDGVNDLLLDCSDAHSYANSTDKDRLGNCFTWIKADTTFEGLKHALREPNERIFIGELPPKLNVVAQNKTKYIHEVRISKIEGSALEEVWFEQICIPINHDLVAIIGNKGTGKSALADIIGLVGASKRDKYFSFLNEDKFRDPKANKAKHFEATVEFEAGSPARGRLDTPSDPSAVPLVRYLPQNYIERLCNEIAAGPSTDFDRELKTIIFSHVPEANRLGLDSLDAVIAYRTTETKEAIALLKRDLSGVNELVLTLEEQSGAAYRTALEKALSAKETELAAHDGSAPKEVKPPELDPATQQALMAVGEQLVLHRAQQATLATERAQRVNDQTVAAQKIAASEKVLAGLNNLSEQVARFANTYAGELRTLGLQVSDVITSHIRPDVLVTQTASHATAMNAAKERIAAIDTERTQIGAVVSQLSARLDEPTRAYQVYLSARQAWEARRLEITGNSITPDTIEYLKVKLADIPAVPQKLTDAGDRRREIVKQIFRRLAALADVYRGMYAAVQNFIDTHVIARDKFKLQFHVSIASTNFKERFVDFVNRGVSGSFCGIEESDRLLSGLLAGCDFSSEADVVAFVDTIADNLRYDKRGHAQPYPPIDIQSQLRKGHSALSLL